jgi:hypothetical protein
VAYLSVLVSFLGGRAHGSFLAVPPRWGCGKCTVILEEWNQKWEWIKDSMPDYGHGLYDSLQGPRTHSWVLHWFPTLYTIPALSAQLFSHLLNCWEVNTTGLQASFKGLLEFGQKLRIHVWRDSCHLKAQLALLILESWQETRTQAANEKWVLWASGWPSVWEKCH